MKINQSINRLVNFPFGSLRCSKRKSRQHALSMLQNTTTSSRPPISPSFPLPQPTTHTHTHTHTHIPSHPLSLPLNLTACPYFCNLVMSPSPCLTTSAYCLFLSSGRFVSMILLTRSMVQGMRSAAMNLARSLFEVSLWVFMRGRGGGAHTDLRSRRKRQNRAPCCRGRRRGSSAVIAGMRAGASRARTSPCARTGSGLG